MSGYTQTEMTGFDILESGGQFISKPFTAAGLAGKVREALHGPGSPNGSDRTPARS
jgi:hypothetical protein